MAKTIINMTPHAITVDNGNATKVYEPCGTVARMQMETVVVGDVDGFEIVKNEVVGHNLPEQNDDTLIIVSAMVLSAVGRGDLIAPDTNRANRNEKGHIVSVPGFVKA